jgi:uncharacterized membrane protein (UPF0127 family)
MPSIAICDAYWKDRGVRKVVAAAVILAVAGNAAWARPALERAKAIIDTGARRIVADVEVADSPAEWQRGLMFRRSLPRNAGMIFVFPRDRRGGFWMKNTLIPLSIAFSDRRGRILRILVMAPCRSDPCRIYDPGIAYRSALEVNQGAFRRWGVTRGDRITLRR